MRYTDIIYLISKESSKDSVGNIVYTETPHKVYAIKRKVGSKEFYNATAVGISVDAELRIKESSYHGEDEVQWGNVRYSVVRTLPFNHQDIVIVLSRKQGVDD